MCSFFCGFILEVFFNGSDGEAVAFAVVFDHVVSFVKEDGCGVVAVFGCKFSCPIIATGFIE